MSLLIVSPHIDDETLGAGGTLLRYSQSGEKIYWINIANTKEEYGYSKQIVKDRTKQVNLVKRLYGFEQIWDFALKPANLEAYSKSELIGRISEILIQIKPEIIIIPHENDIHSDHKVVFNLMLPFVKSFRYPFIKRVMSMEIISETEYSTINNVFKPNYFVDITEFLEEKLEIMKNYESELGEQPFPRNLENIRALAHYRGSMAGVKFAEAFSLIKCIE